MAWRGNNRVRRRPSLSVTAVIIVVCLVVGAAQWIFPHLTSEFLFYPPLAGVQPYRFITSAFLHSGFWHIVLNLYTLWLIGRALEPICGGLRFLVLYLITAVGGNSAVLLYAQLTGDWNVGVVGASGAIFGLFGAFLVVSRAASAPMAGIVTLVGLNLIYGFVVSGVSWQSHVGGLIMGMLLMGLWVWIGRHTVRHKKMRIVWHTLAALVCAVIAVVPLLLPTLITQM